jgi:hypothetical protein
MRFSVNGGASWGSWRPYASAAVLALTSGAGEKTVLAKYRDAAGNVLELSDAITFAPPSRDTTAPTVIAAGAVSGAWYNNARLVTLSASDEPGGSGAASITYTLDGVETTVPGATAVVNVPALPNAAHSLTFCATDAAGNACGEQTLTFTIDSAGPVTAANATSGRAGHAIALRFKVGDNLSPKATAIRIVVKNGRGTVVKTIRPTTRNTGTWYSAGWTPKAKGTYRYYVYANDLAGNPQGETGSARVVVR